MKKNITLLLLSAVLIFLNTARIFSQTNITFDKISIKDGISSNVIWDFCQDKYGFMWIATADGLNRYDGYSFTIFKNEPADSTTIPSNKVLSIIEDHEGILWISTTNGISKFDRDSETFRSYRFSNSTRENSNFVPSVFEDSKGTLWAATTDGILSFDKEKEQFIKYEVLRVDNTIAAMVSSAFNVLETSKGVLYFSSGAFGLLRFDYDNNLFVQVKLKNHFQDKLSATRSYSLIEDSNGDIWCGSRSGLFKIDPIKLTGEELFNTVLNKRFSEGTGIIETTNNKILIGTLNDGLFSYDLSTKNIEKFSVQERGFYRFYFDRTGLLWAAVNGGILKLNFGKAPFELYTLEQESNGSKSIITCFSLSKYDPSKMWMGSIQGLYQFDRVNKKLIENSSALKKINSYGNFRIEDIVESDDQKLYLGTTESGLIEYDLRSGSIKAYKPQLYSRTSIRFDDVNALLKDKRNRIWVGQDRGVSFLNDDGTFTRIPNFIERRYNAELISHLEKLRSSRNPLSQIIEVGDYADISKEFVISQDSYILISGIGEGLQQFGMVDYGMLQNAEGDTLWSMRELESTFRASGREKNRHKIGILQLPKGRFKLSYISDDSHSAASYNATAPQDSLYWGIELYSLSEQEFTNYNKILESDIASSYMEGDVVMSLFESSDGKIWAATTDGLSEIDPESLNIQNYSTDKNNKFAISNNAIQDICEDNFGNIWIATRDGLNKINQKNNTIKIFREKDGLPSSALAALVMDNDGNLWVSGLKGISKVEINDSSKAPIFINFDVRDGLQGYTFIGNSGIKDQDGKLYFSGPDGFNAFYPGNTDKSLPQLVITSVSVSNKTTENLYGDVLSSKNLNGIELIELSHDQNDISFEFSSVHFARPDKNRLQYKMEGVDDEWHDGSKRIASYTNLDPGEYVFKVRGSNGDGFWTNDPKTIKVSITPAWWANTYAYIGYVVIFFGFLFGVRKFEMERRSRVNEYKQSELRAEAAELKAIAAEAERKMLEAENDRKTQELEEARSLQLSMLPRELPQLPNLDIAVYMKTATEVGGDYYDFHVGMDGVLTVVLGDATGHGMKAGTMVTTTKSLFNVLAPNPNIVETFHEMTRCLKLMQLEKLSMCMSMLKIAGNRVQMSSAGMPPIFIYKKDERVIEEHVMQGMPLGTMAEFPYKLKESNLNAGDTILIMSDGFPELLNDKNEAFGYKRVRNLFEENSAKTPEDIISVLKNEGDIWTNHAEPDDDVTFVVIKVK